MSNTILKVKLDGLDLIHVKSRITEFLKEDRLHQITPVNPEFIMAAQKDESLLDIANQSDITVADGVGLMFMAKFLGVDIGERVTGVDLTWELAKIAAESNVPMYFLGASSSLQVRAAERLKAAQPDLKVAGTYSGTPGEAGLVERINESGAGILLVAYGVPKQEKFISANRARLNVKVAMCVGGTFDFIAGMVPRAPKWIRVAGLEWLFRLFIQPKRINRIITATVRFPMAVMADKFTRE
ncbi:MAG: WecB/TagA/CpsF family glycosyltransferase [Bacteroidetes bacterium]|nr:WecB/TagA/CpsF family glycosyltransferase [Bacteroidota bacterium]